MKIFDTALEKTIKKIIRSDSTFEKVIKNIFESRQGLKKLMELILDDQKVFTRLTNEIAKSEKTFAVFVDRISEKEFNQTKLGILKKLIEKFFNKFSYAQSGEDLIVDFMFKTIKINKPTYLDIGAYDPFEFSNTAFFYLNGSRGINIEPNPDNFSRFLKYRSGDVNLNIGIARIEGESDYYVFGAPTLNTCSKNEAKEFSKVKNHKVIGVKKIKVDTLNNILNKYSKGGFPDFLSLDAEGADDIVLNSIDYSKNYPKIICVETISYSENGRGIKDKKTIKFLKDKGYLLYADTHINSIFIKKNLWIQEE